MYSAAVADGKNAPATTGKTRIDSSRFFIEGFLSLERGRCNHRHNVVLKRKQYVLILEKVFCRLNDKSLLCLVQSPRENQGQSRPIKFFSPRLQTSGVIASCLCPVRPSGSRHKLPRQLMQSMRWIHQRIQHAEVMQARQLFTYRHGFFTPDLLNHLVVAQKLVALVAACHAV